MVSRTINILASGFILILTLCLVACGAAPSPTATATVTPHPSPSPTATAPATATPTPGCAQLVAGSSPFVSIPSVPGLSLPASAYVSAGASSGGSTGTYNVHTYTACFQGAESAIDGPSASTVAQLKQSGWALSNLFPDPGNFAYLDYCSNSHNCLNTSGSGNPFTFIGFDGYGGHAGGLTTFRLQVATIAAPTCLNDPTYYSGSPKYTLYYDGNSPSPSGDPRNHFLMPPGTRVSTFQGGGTAGSTYVYYCSAGSQSSVVGFLQHAMSNDGWAISAASASGFTATIGSGPTYTISVVVQNPNNYYLRVFIPM